MKRLLWIGLVLLSACAPLSAAPTVDTVATVVAATFEAMTPLPTPTPGPTPEATQPPAPPTATPALGVVTGRVCYPAGVRSMKAFFQDAQTGGAAELALNGEAEYRTELPPGTYVAYAWLPDFSRSVAYADAGRRLQTFTVTAGGAVGGVDLCELYPAYGAVPYPPGYSPQAITGAISGSIYGYPGEANARLLVVITNRTTRLYEYAILLPGVRFYTFTQLSPGQYNVVVYDAADRRGGAGPVTVTAGATASGDVSDWSGAYPEKPAAIPFP